MEADERGVSDGVEDRIAQVSWTSVQNRDMEKINNIDFDSLNNSIKSLSEVIEPLSKFFGIMGGASGAPR